jgi:mono/diheme cytochrome c family protein
VKGYIFIFLKLKTTMKKFLTIIVLTVLVWGCARKVTPVASGTGMSSNSGTVGNAPATAAHPETAPIVNTTPLGTTPATPAGTRSPEGTATKTPEMLGQSTYNAKCGKCHGLKIASDYTVDRWISVMQVMAPKAKLDDTEKENVLAYVKANAKK